MTTLIDPRTTSSGSRSESLWLMMWANVETIRTWAERGSPPTGKKPELLFPWMGPTRNSEKKDGGPTSPSEAHPLQAYFGMPRRIRLEFAGKSTCELTGRQAEATVTGFRMRNYGVEYSAWHHPFSPYYRSQRQGEWLPVHPQPDGLGWKDWCAVVVDLPDSGSRPSAVVSQYQTHRGRAIDRRSASAIAFGADFDNMKCRGWVEARLPIFLGANPAEQTLLNRVATRLTRATELAAAALRFAVKNALFATPDDANGGLAFVSAGLWAVTEAGFYSTLSRLAGAGAVADAGHAEQAAFQQLLVSATLGVFDQNCPMDGVAPMGLRRVVAARYGLWSTLHGHGKIGAKLFAEMELALLAPVAKKARTKVKKGGVTS